MHLNLLELQITLAAVKGADEGYFICQLSSLTFESIRLTKFTILIIILALLALVASFNLGAVIARE